jgi:multidrug efflux pump subunit AcrB
MWIVNLALRRPYTFIVLSVFILIAGVLSILSTPKDIFPSINIPVISVIWTYTGMAPRDISDHLTSPYERVLTTVVDNIEHIESESLYGTAVVKIFLQPNASVPQGIAQVTAVSQTILKQLPIATTPPLILSYNASNVPVLMVGLSGLSEQQLNDYGLNFIRTQLITVPGAAIPYPYGGKMRYLQVDLNYKALQGYGLTPYDVINFPSSHRQVDNKHSRRIPQQKRADHSDQNLLRSVEADRPCWCWIRDSIGREGKRGETEQKKASGTWHEGAYLNRDVTDAQLTHRIYPYRPEI